MDIKSFESKKLIMCVLGAILMISVGKPELAASIVITYIGAQGVVDSVDKYVSK